MIDKPKGLSPAMDITAHALRTATTTATATATATEPAEVIAKPGPIVVWPAAAEMS